MNPNTMTIDEIRDELARREGWKYVWVTHFGHTWTNAKGKSVGYHPIPATLDEAAKLPEGWFYAVEKCPQSKGPPVFECNASPSHEDGGTSWQCVTTTGDTEMEARFRLRLACTLADEGSKT